MSQSSPLPKIYILRATASGSGWRLRYAIAVDNPVDALITTIQIGGDNALLLADALRIGAKLAWHNFEAMQKFNKESPE